MITEKMQKIMFFLLENDNISFQDQKVYKNKRHFKTIMYFLIKAGYIKKHNFSYSLTWKGRNRAEELQEIGID